MKNLFTRLLAKVSILAMVGSVLLVSAPAQAANITSAKSTMTRNKIAVAAVEHDMTFTLASSVTGTLTIVMDSSGNNFTPSQAFQSGSCVNGTIDSFSFNAGGSGSDVLTARMFECDAGAVTLSDAQATNPGSAGSYTIAIYAGGDDHTTEAAALAAATDTGTLAVAINNDDQVTVTAEVGPTMNFQIYATTTTCTTSVAGDGGTVDMGVVPTATTVASSGANSVNHICSLVSVTNATGGYSITVKSAQGQLTSTSQSLDDIPDSANSTGEITMSAGTESYGLCMDSAEGNGATAGGTVTANSVFDGDADCTGVTTDGKRIGKLTTGVQAIASDDGPVVAQHAQFNIKVAAGTNTESHDDYTDTLTFVATATF